MELRPGEHHLMEAVLPPGSGSVRVHYAGLWFFRLFDAMSAVAAIWFAWLWRRVRSWRLYPLFCSGSSRTLRDMP